MAVWVVCTGVVFHAYVTGVVTPDTVAMAVPVLDEHALLVVVTDTIGLDCTLTVWVVVAEQPPGLEIVWETTKEPAVE